MKQVGDPELTYSPPRLNEKPLAQVIKSVFQELSSEPKQKNTKLASSWPRIVGDRIAGRTNVKFSESNVVIWADNSALAFELSQKYKASILKRLQNEFGEEEVKSIWVCVGRTS